MAEVVLEGVTKVYPGDVAAVKSLDLEIRDRELIVLVGPSGCGKSTTLRMVAGLEDVTEGTIRIGDRVVNDVPPRDRDIAMVFQNYALYPHMTVYKNMAFGLMLRGYSKQEIGQRVSEAAKILGIENLLDRKPKALSGGQRQRVAVGRAIVRKPAAFLLDEPLSNLDAKLRTEMRAELQKLHRRLETTMIYVTHDQIEAMTLGDRIVVMAEGVILQLDTPLSVYHYPANRFVGGFIGTPPMNFLDGRLELRNGKVFFVQDGSSVQIVLPDRLQQRMKEHAGGAATLGMRPENIQDRSADAIPGSTFKARVNVVEPLGDEMIVYVNPGKSDLICKIDSRHRIEVGQELEFMVDLDRIHIFDAVSGKNISLNGSA
ncbi:MAG TPA: sn-glycerol-3-phosphate ABC transporter ATP-binding protein UgpC [Planctomycetota bacterium]|nr:sn-glycerol-3-phosphate ABC transporter ATP-binding protein UgpC [Planctomycetota bacterium]HUW34470.1 sn-glycerol-3-phosphate ABC transporter ATP-binding protein UgpC [Planctomycetota bacterium]